MRAKRTAAALLSSAGQPWPQPSPQGRGGRSRGFTLTELLIVIAILILLLSVAVPAVSRLLNAGREDSAFAALGAAIATARPYASRPPPPMPDTIQYQGAALIVTPANELRIVEHYENIEGINPFSGNPETYNCYRDISGEGYIQMPAGVGVVGLTRRAAAAPHLLAPPFALRFDRNGHLIVRNIGNGAVLYDADYDGAFKYPQSTSDSDRGTREDISGGYNPRAWEPEVAGKKAGTNVDVANFHEVAQKYMMPVETLETVIGVIAFNKQSVRDHFGPDAIAAQNVPGNAAEHGNLRPEVRTWLFENGKVMFFNRYSGAVIKP